MRARVAISLVCVLLIGPLLIGLAGVSAAATLPAGPLPDPNWKAEGNQVLAEFGTSVSSAGDVNGDGFDDVIVGAPYYSHGQGSEGRAYVYKGSASGLSRAPSWLAEGDQASAYFGRSVSTAGDVNGDGFDDVVVGADAYDGGQENEGKAFAYYGSASGLSDTPDWTAESNQSEAAYGVSIGTAGDVNGDGYDDVVVGALYWSRDLIDQGAAFLYLGSAAGLSTAPAWTAEGDQQSELFGSSVGTAGDVNGDGYDDVIVGATQYDDGQSDEGGAFVYLGSSSGVSTTPVWTGESNVDVAYYGVSVGTAGDVNGDGFDDVIVGAYNESPSGRAFAYYGSPSGPSLSPDWMTKANQPASVGISVGTAGDVNGDGFDDAVVGAFTWDHGQTDEGRAFVFHGSARGLSRLPDWVAEGNQSYAYLGSSAATAGDVTGDGLDDVIVGAPEFDHGQLNEGTAFAYYGPI